jgi:hypothetical protein
MTAAAGQLPVGSGHRQAPAAGTDHCANCAVLSEALLEAEFLKELSTAQAVVLAEDRDLLAQQHESLLQLLVDSNMGCPDG